MTRDTTVPGGTTWFEFGLYIVGGEDMMTVEVDFVKTLNRQVIGRMEN
tara:strand:- start:253 stop:396 length:144 start_codon:yes stop_codon:yes gene_type:complete